MPIPSTPAAVLRDTYVCRDITLSLTRTGDGWMPPVASVTIELTEQMIPRAFLTVDPAHTELISGVTPAGLGSMYGLSKDHDHAQQFASDPTARAVVSISLTNTAGGLEQKVKLEDWLVVAVGITGLAATGQFALEVELQHPVGLLDRSTAALGNQHAEPKWEHANYDNIVTGLSEALSAHAIEDRVGPVNRDNDTACIDANGSVTVAYAKVKTDLEAQAKLIPEYLEWVDSWPANDPGYSKWPFEDTCYTGVPDLNDCVKYALTAYSQSLERMSIWNIFAGAVLPDYQLTIMPTYWKKQLQVTPYTPWGKPAIVIYDDEISDISFPGVDAAPVGGVRMSYTGDQESPDLTFFRKDPAWQNAQISTEVVYIPPRGRKCEEAIGRILPEQAPSWFITAMYCAAGKTGGVEGAHDATALQSSETSAEGEGLNSGALPPLTDQQAMALYGICKQYFLAKVKAQVEASFATPLLIKAEGSAWLDSVSTNGGGGWTLPGCVVRVKARAKATSNGQTPEVVVFDMYVMKITHTLSVGGRTARTEWSGGYCRPENAFDGLAVNGTWNPMYDPNPTGADALVGDGGCGGGGGGGGQQGGGLRLRDGAVIPILT